MSFVGNRNPTVVTMAKPNTSGLYNSRLHCCYGFGVAPPSAEYEWEDEAGERHSVRPAEGGVQGGGMRFFWVQKDFFGYKRPKCFFFDTKCFSGYKMIFSRYNIFVLDIFGGQWGLINCKIVLDILEGQKRPGWVQLSANQKAAAKAAESRKRT